MLEKIEESLKNENFPIFYGLVSDEDMEVWNYYVYNRSKMEKAGNTDYKQYYEVHIICENHIPEAMVTETIKKIKKIPGMRLADIPVDYAYTKKKNTDLVVEIATLTFVRQVRGCDAD